MNQEIRKKGYFITFEGGDGSGKSTQIARLAEFLKSKNYNVVLTREPGGTSIGEKIRTIILDKCNSEMSSMTEAMLYAASRSQHVYEVIQPAINKGDVVICDRFIDSSIAYQGFGRNLGNSVSIINQYAIRDCIPDITFLLKLKPQIGNKRMADRDKDRIELEGLDFHEKVYAGYQELEQMYPDRIVAIDASMSIETIEDEIKYHVNKLIAR